MKKRLNILTCVIFCIFIFGFTIASLVTKPKEYSERERRYLEQMPKLSKETFLNGEFTSKYETYITDQFVGRDQWIRIKTIVERMAGKQDINNVYFAKDGYLIEKVEEQDLDLEQWEKNKKWLSDFLVKYEEKLGKEHVRALFVPTAGYVLEEKLPPYAPFINQGIINQEIRELVGKKVSDEIASQLIVDVNQNLKDKSYEYIYYKTDHHWTSLGAYYAYEVWAKSLGLTPKPLEEYKQVVATSDFYGTIYNKVNTNVSPDQITLFDDGQDYTVSINMGEKELNSMFDYEQLESVDKYSIFLGGNNAMTQVTSSNKNGKKLLVVKDSYAHTMVPILAHHFEEVVLVDLRYLNMGLEEIVDQFGITDVLLLYNDSTVMSDKNLVKLGK
ncbi:DHHW family protein [Anaerosporobacter sp.]